MPIPVARRRPLALVALAAVLAALATATAWAGGGTPPPGDGYAGVSGEADRGRAVRTRLDVGPTLPGIDVSHWQGDIDWRKVAGAGKRFAFLKATDGHSFLDPTFFENRAQARANGIVVGAYHFARPDPSKGDAAEEARWFVSKADPRPGHLLPVLDLETSEGLDQQGVTLWARRWVAEVRRLTGVTALVYTSPYGWMSRTGDSRALARDGAPLWIAHWGVSSPTLPAGDWDGRGWRVWQHTSHGHVAGIAGRVDLDVVPGKSLGPITIRRLSLQVDGGAGKVVSAPTGLGCRSTCSKSVDPNSTVTLTARPDDDAFFTGWGGACSGNGPTCTLTFRGNRSVTAGFVSDVTAPTAAVDVAGGFRGPATVTFDEPVRRVGPSNVLLRGAGGARVEVSRTCRSAAGRAVRCGGPLRSVELSPASPLVPGRDYRVIVNPPGTGPVVDRVGNPADPVEQTFRAPSSVEERHAPVRSSPDRAWRLTADDRASRGSFTTTKRTGADTVLRFDGRGVDWITVTGPNRGRARVWIDGERRAVIDLSSPTRTFGVVHRFDGLSAGTHTLRIEVLGRGGADAGGRGVSIDRFDVLPG